MPDLMHIYSKLYKKHGAQGWWPTGTITSYHPGDYSYPKTESQKFEICVGAILTQNTAWKNVEKALLNLKNVHCLNPEKILSISHEKLAKLINPSGYFNQKAKKLVNFSGFFIKIGKKTPKRDDLLNIWGIGPETADSILLYAYKVPIFIVDAYTKRLFTCLGIIEKTWKYHDIQAFFENHLEKDYKLYQEFHALIVEEGKNLTP
ncbi:endonuclease III domain-containing protein [Candidatus Margulisiibacteriota bacterium]